MLLDDLLEASVVQLSILGQVVDIGDDIAQVFFEQQKVFLGRLDILVEGSSTIFRAFAPGGVAVQEADHLIDLLFAGLDPPHDLARLDPLKGKDLVQLGLQELHERFLVVFGPFSSLGGRTGLQGGLERRLEVVIGDVVIEVVRDERRAELLAD
jgi:hypothetical protein